MKRAISILIVTLVIALAGSFGQSVAAQPTQVNYTLNLTYLNVRLFYPSEILPGQSVTVNVQAAARDSFRLQSLTLQVYFSDGTNLRQLTSATIGKDTWMQRGDQINQDVQASVPLDAPRTSLVAFVSETARIAYYDYSYYYAAYYPYYYYPYSYNYTYYYVAYPSYNYASVTDNGIAPLSYIKATTPEYVSLQSDYQMLQQKLDQAQTANQQLTQDVQAKQGTINDQNFMITNLNQQLASAKSTITLLEVATLVLVALVVAIGIFAFRSRTRKSSELEQVEQE